jgi:hypothetical protein
MTDATPPICEKPAAVTKAVTLLYLTLVITVVLFFLNWSLYTQVDVGVVAFSLLFDLGLMGLLIYKIDEGRNWARIAYLVIFIIGMPFYIRAMCKLFSFSMFGDLFSLLRAAMEIVALKFLFSREARPWFGAVKTDVPSTPDDSQKNSQG